MNSNVSEENFIVSYIKSLNYKDLIIFLIPFAIFIYFLHVYDPGILNGDAYNQLHQITTNQFTNWHPFFHTFIERTCLEIFPTPLSVGIFQITLFSAMWTIICKYNRNSDKFDKFFILQVIITLIIALIPINAIYSISLDKDTLFSYFLMFLCFLIQVMVNKKGNIGFSFALLMSITMAFVSQIRPNGMIMIIIFLVLLAIYLYKNFKTNKMYLIIPILTITCILLISSLNIVYDVENTQKDAILDKTSHMLSYYDLNVDVSDADKEKIYQLISKDTINNNFDIHYTDPTYFHVLNHTAYKNDKMGYVSMVIKYTLQNPIKFMEYLFESSPIVWDITRDDDWEGYAYYTDYSLARNNFYNEHKDYKPENPQIDNASSKNMGTAEYNTVDSYVNAFTENHVLDTLFNSPALYMYLSFILLGMMYFITRSKDMLLIYVPNLINILTVMISIPIQSNRYLYSNLVVFYLLLIIFIGILSKNGFKIPHKSMPISNNPDKNDYVPQENIYGEMNYNEPIEIMHNNEDNDDLSLLYDEILSGNSPQEETIEEMEARIRAKILKEYEDDK